MDLEVINMMKEPLSTIEMDKFVLIDQDGFQFHVFSDKHLQCYSMFSKNSKMDRFYGLDLLPKIKAIGAVPFQLPNDDEAVYSISVKNGSIREA